MEDRGKEIMQPSLLLQNAKCYQIFPFFQRGWLSGVANFRKFSALPNNEVFYNGKKKNHPLGRRKITLGTILPPEATISDSSPAFGTMCDRESTARGGERACAGPTASEPPVLPAHGSRGGHGLMRLVKGLENVHPQPSHRARRPPLVASPKAAPPPSLLPPGAALPLLSGSEVSRQIVRQAKWSPEGGQ